MVAVKLKRVGYWCVFGLFVCALVVFIPVVNAQTTNNWALAAGDKWEAGTNWSLGVAPSTNSQSQVQIGTNGVRTVTIDATTSGSFPSAMIISNLTVLAASGSTNTLFLNGAGTSTPFRVLNTLTVGSNGIALISNSVLSVDGIPSGNLIVSDGSLTLNTGTLAATNVNTSIGSTGRGQITVSNGSWLARGVSIGTTSAGRGTLTMDGGTNLISSNLTIGATAGSSGTVWVTGGQFTMPVNALLRVGNGGSGQMNVTNGTLNLFAVNVGATNGAGGTLTISGGSMTLSNQLTVGFGVPSATGTVWVTGGLLTSPIHVIKVGLGGVGRMIVSNGTVRYPTIDVANFPGSAGTATFAGGTHSVDTLTVASFTATTGTVWLTGGVLTNKQTIIAQNFAIGRMSISNGTMLASNIIVGLDSGSRGTLTVAGGTTALSADLTVGSLANATGTVLVTAGQLTASNGITTIGSSGVGQMTVSNGAAFLRDVYVGFGAGSRGTLTMAGGTNLLSSVLHVGKVAGANGAVWVTGGELLVTNAAMVVGHDGTGRMTQSNGTVTVNQLVVTNGANSIVSIVGGTFTSGGTFVTNGQNFAVGDGGSLATYRLNGGTHTFNNGLRIRTASFLTGCGTITGNVLVEGTVLADCGTTFNFGGTVTNDGTVIATGGTVLNFYGPVVNNSLIDNTSGNIVFLSGISGSGLVITPTNSWTDGSGKWETATNWSQSLSPSSSDAANVISNAGNNTITIDATTSGSYPGTMTIRNLDISGVGGSTNALSLNNAGLATPLHVLLGFTSSNASVVTVDNSALQVDGLFKLGSPVGSDNQLIVTNGGLLVSTDATIGGVSGFNNSALVTGSNSLWSSYGKIQVGLGGTNGTLTVANDGALIVTNVTHTGQVLVNGGLLVLGTGTFKTDSLVVTNGGSVRPFQTYQVDNATVTVASGGLQAGSNFVVGSTAGSTGAVAVTGGQLTVTNGVVGVGNDGTVTSGGGVGSVIVSNGTVSAAAILLGSTTGGQGELTLANGGTITGTGTNPVLIVNGFDQIGGGLIWSNGTMYCGYAHPGAYALSNGTSLCQDVYVGYDNSGSMTVAGGTMDISSRLTVGHLGPPFSVPVSTGEVWITGGQLTMNSLPVIIGNSGVGLFSMSNGTVTAAAMVVGNGSNSGTLTLAGGTLTVNSLLVTNPGGRFVFSGGWLNAQAISNSNGQAVVVGNGFGLALLNLTGGNSTVDAGLTIMANATLSGYGTITGCVVNYGRVSASGGALTFAGCVFTNYGTVSAASGASVSFNGTVANYGVIVTNGAVTFNAGVVNHGVLLDPAGDADGDGMTNEQEMLAGTDPTDSDSVFRIIGITRTGNDVQVSWSAVGGKQYVLQVAPGAGGSYSNNFTDLSSTISVLGSGESVTNCTETGGASTSGRYYRVRLGP